jgi:hypothetical protein
MRISPLIFLNKKWTHSFSQQMMMNTPTDLRIAMHSTIHSHNNIDIPTSNNNNLKNKNTPIKSL